MSQDGTPEQSPATSGPTVPTAAGLLRRVRAASPRRRFAMALAAVLIVVLLSLGFLANQAVYQPHAGASGPIALGGLLHDSRDPFYRSPGGAAPTGSRITLRLRTQAGNVSKVLLRTFDAAAAGGHGDVVWYTATRAFTRGGSDVWEVRLPAGNAPRVLWYKWEVIAGHAIAWYEDQYDQAHGNCDQVGGVGHAFADGHDPDCPYELNVYQGGFTVPDWIKHAVVYQIFVDRFFNGSVANDALVQPNRYDGQCAGPDGKPTSTGAYLHRNWNDEPIKPAQNCDFFGGDLQGIIAKLDYLHQLGITALYLTPIFMADSNHKYDTTDYTMIDPHFGNLAVWQQLVARCHALGMHMILDGVFNHTSSDSIYFDRYHTWRSGGADETQSSRYADWYQFTTWPDYNGWFGVDALPQLSEQQDVANFLFAGDATFVQDANDAAIRQRYGEQPLTVTSGANAVGTYWLAEGADGWRLDSPESKSDAWWRAFRAAIRAYDPQALLIGEHWGNASEWLLGDQQDGTMNYRFRSAVLGFFDNGGIDPDPGHDSQIAYSATQFNAHLQAILEQYPLPAVYASLNLVDSHDTGRILWELGATPDATSAQVALAKQRLKLIALFQMTWIGAPMIYYGDEAGQSQIATLDGKVDPGDRRTFPWDHQDSDLENWYQLWIGVRNANPVLQTGAETTLLTDDANHLFAFERHDGGALAVVVLNADAPAHQHTVTLVVAGAHDGMVLTDVATQERFTVTAGKIVVPVDGTSGRVLLGPVAG